MCAYVCGCVCGCVCVCVCVLIGKKKDNMGSLTIFLEKLLGKDNSKCDMSYS